QEANVGAALWQLGRDTGERRAQRVDGEARAGPDRPDQQSAKYGTAVVPAAAEHQHDPDEERAVERVELPVVDGDDVVSVERAADAHDHRAHDERLHAERSDVLPAHRGRVLVPTHGAEDAAPWRADGSLEAHVP